MKNKKYKILSLINSPDDLKALSRKSLNELSLEIADYINEVITKLGGHYSSPLGVIDLTIALHYVYSSPKDKIIWDVGHQAYSHKILTGRRDAFAKIRQLNEISGFLKRSESPHDIFGAGHSSTSISAGLGFAHMRDRLETDDRIITVIGDGAMTNGMVFEALNNVGYHKTQMTIILNDNSFSISESVGALSTYLTKLVTNPTYNSIRDGISKISKKIPEAMGYSTDVSNDVQKILKKAEAIKTTFTPGGLFEELGLMYIGPIDGHDINNLIYVLNQISKIDKPVLLHIYTDKSKYVNKHNKDPIKFYSLSPKNNKSINKQNKDTFSSVFGKSIFNLASYNNFTCITAAMKVGTGLSDFSRTYKRRYIDVGIAEEHAVTYGAGLSAAGELPIITIYSTFMQRAYDQIIHDISLQNLPAVLCMDRAGLVANDGPTHHGVFDIAFMRTIPNAIVTAPANGNELFDLLYTAIKSNKLFSIRYGKLKTKFNASRKPKRIPLGSWEIINSGDKIVLLAVGSMVEVSRKVVDRIKDNYNINVGLINCRFVKPLDFKMLDKILKKYKTMYTLEEGIIAGGFGSSILEYSSLQNNTCSINLIGIKDDFVEHGSRSELLDIINMSEDKIYKQISMAFDEKR